ncbi:acyltransferase family protein [Desulfitobacterium sp. THU1]|uniref:acyltransferase family protein n=1 Tax=Desulfitobacterium sp. THU1 TaxID=3138072 RepID=UPI00311F2CA0
MNCSKINGFTYEQADRQQRGRRVRTDSGGYMPGLDGLRALAVLAVIAYHLNLAWAPGGLLGVTLFFVLSGFLITNLLMKEWESTGGIDLKEFWLRRARRLLPAVFVMLAGVMTWMVLWAPERLAALQQEALAAVFYISNWYLIFHQVSYFESFGPPSPLGHLWSLAVEEQFYLIWPLLLGLGLSWFRQRKCLTGVTIALILVSAVAMAIIYLPGQDPSRVYYGTDTRAFSLLVGAVLAMVWPRGKMSGELTGFHKQILDITGVLSLLIVLLLMGRTNQYQPFLYQGGLLLFSVAAAILVAVLTHPASILSRIFSWRPLRWLGECSYGIYLWHYPVIVLSDPVVNTGDLNLSRTLWQIGLCIVLAALSRYLIEDPIRYGRRRRGRRRTKTQVQPQPQTHNMPLPQTEILTHTLKWWQKPWGVTTKVSLSIILMALLLFINPNESTPISAQAIAAQNTKPSEVETQEREQKDNINCADHIDYGDSEDSEDSVDDVAGENPAGAAQNRDITIIGDSVMINVAPVLQERLAGIIIDAQLGRQMYQAAEVIAELREEGKLGNTVIIELGNNGPFSEKQLKQILDSLPGSSEIFLINTRVPKPWEGEVNETLHNVAQSYPRTKLLDWHSVSKGHKDYFYDDGVHLTQPGVAVYEEMLVEALGLNSQK